MFFTKKNFNFPASFEKALFEYWFQDPNATANQYKSKEFNRKTETIAQNLEHLWTLLAIDRGMNSQKKFAHYSMNEKFTHAYASYYLPANALKSTLILEEMFQMGLDLPDEIHWSDFGTGPGTLFWGLLQFLENHKEKKNQVHRLRSIIQFFNSSN